MVLQAVFLLCSAEANEPVKISLADALKTAVEKNLDLRAEFYNPAMQEAEYRKSKGIYNPFLSLVTNFNEWTPVVGSKAQSAQIDAGVSQLIPTGATATLGFNNDYRSYGARDTLTGLARYWESSLGLSISQPLLKNFGRVTTELAIDLSRLGKDAALEKLQTRIMTLVAQVRIEYFKLYSYQQEREVAKVSLELARRILSETEARVKAGVLPAMEILNAQFGVAAREKELIDAERVVKDQSDLLQQLLQLERSAVIETVDMPMKSGYETSEKDEITRALDNRPELKEMQRNFDIAVLQSKAADNRTLPDLAVTASASTAGVGSSYNQDMDRLSSGKYPGWGVGLTFSYPLGNSSAVNEYRKIRLRTEQLAVEIRNKRELIANEVRAAVRAIDANFKLMEVAERGRLFAEERLNAFVRKADVGLATTKDVLDVERDLAAAKNNQIKARVSYDRAVTELWKATAAILDKQQIRMNLSESDRLYKEIR